MTRHSRESTGEARSLEPEAREEFLAAVEWYRERSVAVARRFVEEVERGLNQIRANPESWPLAPHVPEVLEVRRLLLRKFPYAVVFILFGNEIRVSSAGSWAEAAGILEYSAVRPATWRR